ncbi:NAD(P)H-hydrate epimerase [Pseudooceanicola nitratireducens]|uniref:NAD(P)H-hydrate epimerase n=1 Tax=Pseudooceanicola nitratireducens TaxID=517719 RepID=UPI0030B871B5
MTSDQMRAVERRAIDSGMVTGAELMERAGRGVVDALRDEYPGTDGLTGAPWDGQHVLILCGPGNNGGDGYVVARLLGEVGAICHVLALGDPGDLPPDAAQARRLWTGPVGPLSTEAMGQVVDLCRAADQPWLVVVDALFGIGQRAPLDSVCDAVGGFVDALFEHGGPTPYFVSVDLPTGYDADSGAALARRPVSSNLTVTFHAPKPIHGMPHFLDVTLVVADIGLSSV